LPEFTDGLLKVALIKVRQSPIKDGFHVVRIYFVEDLREDLDCLCILLSLDFLATHDD
jgi:regulator of replication initiation timing